jgi:hypothetical protein
MARLLLDEIAQDVNIHLPLRLAVTGPTGAVDYGVATPWRVIEFLEGSTLMLGCGARRPDRTVLCGRAAKMRHVEAASEQAKRQTLDRDA